MDPEQTATEITIRKDFVGMLQIWPPGGSHNRTNFDLVLVPGLAGGCISTWIHENGNCWLDWLLREITDIRIFAFGYNADNVYLSRKDEQANSYSRVFTDAERLCNGLNDIEGRVENPCPITIIAHGVGGILVKNALVMCQALPNLYGRILRDTHHIVFLDTPHIGLDTNVWQHIYGKTATDHARNQFSLWSQALADTARYFGGISAGLTITSAYPTEPIQHEGGFITVVEESSSALNLPNEIRLCFSNTTHLTMCKFSNTEDVNYKNLRNRIVAEIKKRRNSGILEYFLGDNELRRKVPLLSTHEELDTKTLVVNETQSRMNQNNDANENLRSKMLKWLIPKDSAIDYDAELESNRVKPVAGTCMWIFKTKEYGQWIKGHPSKLFWVHGIPGCGKSTLVASTCRSIRAERKKILHFFFTPESSFSTAFALSSLTQQMVCKSDIVLQALQQKYEHTVASPSRSEPAAAAVTKIALKAFGDCFIFLDAIDNCKDRGELLRNLKNFLDEFPEGIKIFCSSLNEHDIGRAFSNDSTVFEIEMSNTLIKGDIESFIRTAVDQNIDLIEKLNYCPGDKERIIGKLVEGAGGMFLLPKYFIDDLSTLANLTEMYKYLDDLPDGIQNYYLRIISKIDPRCLELTREVFTWAAWASRPLSLGEIRQAFRDDFLCLKQDLKRALGSLINLDDGFVRLSHDTIRRFIRNSEAFKSSPSYKALVHSTPDDYIAKTCVEFLSTPDLNLPSSPQHRFAGQRAAEIRQICPFLEYASCNWVSHWAAASMPLRLLHMISQFFDSDKFLKWLENLGHFLVSEGFESMVSMLMEQLIKLQQRIQRLPRRKNDLIRGWLFLFRLRKISRKVSELSNFLNSWGTVIQNFPDEIHILAPLLEKSFSTHPSQQVFLTRFLELSKTSRLYDSPDGMMLPSTYDRFLLSDLHVFVWRSLMPSFSWNLSCVPLDPDKPGLVALMSISMATRLPHRREGIDPAEVGSLTVTTALRKDHRVVGMAWARFSQDKEQPLTVKTYAWRLTQDPMSAHLVPLQWTYMGNDDPCRVDITHTRTFRMSRCAVAFTEDMETMWTCSGPYNIRTGHRQANPALFTNIRMSELSFSQNCSIVAGIRDHAYLEIYDIPRLNCVASYRGDCTILGVSQRGKFVLFLEKLVSGRSTPETVKSPQRPQYAVSLFSRSGTKTTIWSDDDNYKIQAQRRNQSPSGVTESLSMKMLYNNGGLHAFSQNDKILALCVYALPDWKLLAFDLESADIRRSWWSIDYASTLSGAGIRSLCFCPINERRLYLLDNYGVIRPFDVARADSTNSTEPVTSQKETPPPLTVLVPETSEQPVITITPAFSDGPCDRHIDKTLVNEWLSKETPRKSACCNLGIVARGISMLESETITTEMSPLGKSKPVDMVSWVQRWTQICADVQESIKIQVSATMEALDKVENAELKANTTARPKVTTNVTFDSSATLGFFHSLVYLPLLPDEDGQPRWIALTMMDIRWLETPKWRRTQVWPVTVLTSKEKEALNTVYHPPSKTLLCAVSLIDYNKAINQHSRATLIMTCQLSSQQYDDKEVHSIPNLISSRCLTPDCGFVEALEISNCGNYAFGYSSTWPASIFQLDIRSGKSDIVRKIDDPFRCGIVSCVGLSFHDSHFYVAGTNGIAVTLLRFALNDINTYEVTIVASCPNEVQLCEKISLAWPTKPSGKLTMICYTVNYFRKGGNVVTRPQWPIILSVPLGDITQWVSSESVEQTTDLCYSPKETTNNISSSITSSEPNQETSAKGAAISPIQSDKPSNEVSLEAKSQRKVTREITPHEDKEKTIRRGAFTSTTSREGTWRKQLSAPKVNTCVEATIGSEKIASSSHNEYVGGVFQDGATLDEGNSRQQSNPEERSCSRAAKSEHRNQGGGSSHGFQNYYSFLSRLQHMLCCATKETE